MPTLFNLTTGRVVVVRQGFGLVPIADQTEDVIAYAGKYYAITASGIILTETDRHGVIQRQEVKPQIFYISAKARRLQEAMLMPLEIPYQGDTDWAADLREDLL